jgi:hypothetical protein
MFQISLFCFVFMWGSTLVLEYHSVISVYASADELVTVYIVFLLYFFGYTLL